MLWGNGVLDPAPRLHAFPTYQVGYNTHREQGSRLIWPERALNKEIGGPRGLSILAR